MPDSIVKQALAVAQRSLVIALFGAFLLAVASLAEREAFERWLGKSDDLLRRAEQSASQFLLSDERMAMYANMASATGEIRWAARYEAELPLRERAFSEASRLAPAAAGERFATYTRNALEDLIAREREASSLAQLGHIKGARAIMDSRNYATEKAVILNETNRLLSAIRSRIETDQTWMTQKSAATKFFTVLFGLSLLFYFLNRNIRRSEMVFSRAEEAMRYQAMHDELTGLGSRRAFTNALKRRVNALPGASGNLALISLDLIHLKRINDLYGHVAGDRLLRTVAVRLRTACRADAEVFRLGGDEFAVLETFESSESLLTGCELIIRRVEEPIDTSQGTIALGARLGIATAPGDASDPDSLYRKADIALHHARGATASQPTFYDPRMDQRISERARIEAELPDAIANGAIVPFFQPIMDLQTGRLIGFEALARWEHPERSLIPPDKFISIAEEAGLISDLFYAILRRACGDARIWPGALRVSVNLSPLQFADRDLPRHVAAILADTGLTAGRLEFEVTEAALATDFAGARDHLIALRNMGITIALDDFGTGYSSMRHLAELLIDKIKIDRSFVDALSESKQNAKIVKSMLGLARSLGMRTTAEGIETEDQATRLKTLGCMEGQGYFYSKPMSRLACIAYIENFNKPHLVSDQVRATG